MRAVGEPGRDGQTQAAAHAQPRWPMFDRASRVDHPRDVVRLVHRLAALVITFGLVAGNAAVCAGWMPTPEARMACCATASNARCTRAIRTAPGQSARSPRRRPTTAARHRSASIPTSPVPRLSPPSQGGSRRRGRRARQRPCSRPERRVAHVCADTHRASSQARPPLGLPRLAIHSRRVSARTRRPGA